MTDVVNNKAQHRYELTVDGHLAATYYKVADGVITFIHTEVPPELGGKGVGSTLVKGALDQVRADGLKVIAQCPFVKAYIDKHARICRSSENAERRMATVRDNKAQSRFELDVEGDVAFANYRLTPSAVIITHTETPRALRGRGIASELVEGALA